MAVERSAGPTFHGGGDHRGQRHAHRALVIVTHPPRDLDQRLGKRGDPIINVNHTLDAFWGQIGGRPHGPPPTQQSRSRAPQRHSDTGAQGDGVQFAGDGIGQDVSIETQSTLHSNFNPTWRPIGLKEIHARSLQRRVSLQSVFDAHRVDPSVACPRRRISLERKGLATPPPKPAKWSSARP